MTGRAVGTSPGEHCGTGHGAPGGCNSDPPSPSPTQEPSIHYLLPSRCPRGCPLPTASWACPSCCPPCARTAPPRCSDTQSLGDRGPGRKVKAVGVGPKANRRLQHSLLIYVFVHTCVFMCGGWVHTPLWCLCAQASVCLATDVQVCTGICSPCEPACVYARPLPLHPNRFPGNCRHTAPWPHLGSGAATSGHRG